MENETKNKTAVLTQVCHGYGRDLQCSGTLTCQGTLENQSETIRTPKEPSGMAKKAKNNQRRRQS